MWAGILGAVVGALANNAMNDSNNDAMVRMNDSNNNAAVRMNDSDNLASTAVIGIAAAVGAYGIKKLCESDNSGKALNGNSNTPKLKSGN